MSIKVTMINSMLATKGIAPLAAADYQHPDFIAANDVLDTILEEVQSRHLWFNSQVRKLQPDANDEIVLPTNTLSAEPTDQTIKAAARGGRLFNMDTYTFTFTAPVEVLLLLEVTLDDMPPIAKQYVRAAARFQYFLDQDGDGKKLQMYERQVARKDYELIALNLRHKNENFFDGAAAAAFGAPRAYRRSAIIR